MNGLRLLSRDIRLGLLRKSYIVLLLIIPFAYAVTRQCRVDITMYTENNVLNSACTVLDYWIYSMGGMNVFKFDPEVMFEIPVFWFWFVICASYINAYYVRKDLDDQGAAVILASGKRTSWWLSKSALCVIKVTLYFLMSMILVVLFALANGAQFSCEITSEFLMNRFGFNTVYCSNGDFLVLTVFLPWLTVCAICIAQNALSLYLGSVVSFIAVSVLYILSAYYTTWFLPGNYTMWLRSSYFTKEGISPLTGAAVSAGIILAAMITGVMYINNSDILSKNTDNQ